MSVVEAMIVSFLLGVVMTIVVAFLIAIWLDGKPRKKKRRGRERVGESVAGSIGKSGWVRLSHNILTVRQLFMDSQGNDTVYFLGGIGADHPVSETIQDIPVQNPTRSNRRGYVLSFLSAFSVGKTAVTATKQISNYLISRFKGEETAELPEIVDPKKRESAIPVDWNDVFTIVKQNALFIYSSDIQLDCIRVLILSNYNVSCRSKNLSPKDAFDCKSPLILSRSGAKSGDDESLYLYFQSDSEKEDWFILLSRGTIHSVPESKASSKIGYENAENDFEDIMQTLADEIMPTRLENQSVSWLNAIIGRLFAAVHNDKALEQWVLEKLSSVSTFNDTNKTAKKGTERGDASINVPPVALLSPICFDSIDLGHSVPHFSDPQLIDLSHTGKVTVDISIKYTGEMTIYLSTLATVAVGSFQSIEIPMKLGVAVTHFEGRIRLNLKSWWESRSIWLGLHSEGLDIRVNVDPVVVKGQGLKVPWINSVVQQRFKEALWDTAVLPNTVAIPFYPNIFENNDIHKGSEDENDASSTRETETTASWDSLPTEQMSEFNSISETLDKTPHVADDTNPQKKANVVMTGEIWQVDISERDEETLYLQQSVLAAALNTRLAVVGSYDNLGNNREEQYEPQLDEQSDPVLSLPPFPRSSRKSFLQFAGTIAEFAGHKSRHYKIPQLSSTLVRASTICADAVLAVFGYTRFPSSKPPTRPLRAMQSGNLRVTNSSSRLEEDHVE